MRAFVQLNKIELSITGIFVLLYAIDIIGATEIYTRFGIDRSFMTTLPFIGLMALGAAFVVTLGEIDLSFPSVMGMASWSFAATFSITASMPLAVVAALAVDAGCGLLNGLMVVRPGVPSIVATIGTRFFWRGVVNVLAGGQGIAISPVREHWLHPVFVGRLSGDIPMHFVWFVVIGIIMMFVYHRHTFASHVLFVGDNETSAKMIGIRTGRVKLTCFTLLVAMSALEGVMLLSEVTYFWPSTGEGYLLPALAAVFIGGTPVFGGRGSMYGTFIGALIIGTLEAGAVATGIQGFYTQVIYGLLTSIAVTIHAVIMRRPS